MRKVGAGDPGPREHRGGRKLRKVVVILVPTPCQFAKVSIVSRWVFILAELTLITLSEGKKGDRKRQSHALPLLAKGPYFLFKSAGKE